MKNEGFSETPALKTPGFVSDVSYLCHPKIFPLPQNNIQC